MQRAFVSVLAILGGVAFLGMLKLMNDMTGHMARMTDQVAVMSADMGRMQANMETLVEQVAAIAASVGHMPGLADDVHGIRESVGGMASVINKGSEQIERLNPMEMMQQMLPSGQRR